jgi:hypothetical protein
MWINFNLFICLLEGRGIKRPVEDDYTYAAAEKKAKLVEDMKVPPSSFCRSCKWEEVVPVIFNHRPHDADIPITLYHQVFAHFQDYCTNIHISMDDCDLVIKLITQMTKAFERENDRVAEFLKWTSEYFAHPVTKLPLPQINQEADIGACHSVGNHSFCLLIGEAKNEIGEGHGCSYIQACASYAKQIGANTNNTIRKGLNPSFILYLSGPYLGIAGAVFGKDFTIDPLTHVLPLLYLKNDPEMMVSITRTFKALKTVLGELKNYYSEFQVTQHIDNLSLQRPASFPYPSSFKMDDNRDIKFIYKNQLCDGKLVFRMQGQNEEFKDKWMVVKFTQKYCKEAHKFCEKKEIAPKLFALNDLSGGWKMVVMEYLSDDEYINLYSLLKEKKDNQEDLQQKTINVAKILHSGDYVHGDLRASNIMVSTDMKHIKIIDFDWSGKVDHAVYPHFVSTCLPWHPDVDCEKPIAKEHDLHLLKKSIESNPF